MINSEITQNSSDVDIINPGFNRAFSGAREHILYTAFEKFLENI